MKKFKNLNKVLEGKVEMKLEGDDVEKDWKEFWLPIVTKNTLINMEQIKKELYDYHIVMKNISKVYDHITNGKISKPNTLADVVISVADDFVQEIVEEAIQDEKEFGKDY